MLKNSVQMTKRSANKSGLCPGCKKSVGYKAFALQCDDCQAWQSVGCANLSTALYKLLVDNADEHLVFRCSVCKGTAKRPQALPILVSPPTPPRRAHSAGRQTTSPTAPRNGDQDTRQLPPCRTDSLPTIAGPTNTQQLRLPPMHLT